MSDDDIRQRATTVNLQGVNGGFLLSDEQKSAYFKSFAREMAGVLKYPESQKVCLYGFVNLIATVLLLVWCSVTNSMALTAFTYITIFDIFLLCTGLVTVWVKTQKPTPSFSFGYERFEVVAVFSSTLLAQLGSFFIIKESVERLVQQPDIHEGRLLLATGVAFVVHMVITYANKNAAFDHVINASSSSWLQEHVSDLSESLCHVIPGVSKLLLPRINPFSLIGAFSAAAMLIVFFLIQMKNYHASDTWAAIWIAIMTCGTMFPMTVYTGKILLQTTPSHSLAQLDKCIREAQTLDGVLEFRQEHFWTLSFGTMAGSVQVRVRRDADEQMVLAHVYHRLANIVPVLTVHIFKDDWISKSNVYALGGGQTQQPIYGKLPDSGSMPLPLMTSTPANTPSKPYNFVSTIPQSPQTPQIIPASTQSQRPLDPATNYINTSHLNPQVLSLLGSPRAQVEQNKFN